MGVTEKIKIGCGNLYVSVNADEQGICEIFTNTGRAGGCASQSEATARLISISLRSGISINSILDQIKGIRCAACIRREGVKVMSCPDAIARVIEKYMDVGSNDQGQAVAKNGANGNGLSKALEKLSDVAARSGEYVKDTCEQLEKNAARVAVDQACPDWHADQSRKRLCCLHTGLL